MKRDALTASSADTLLADYQELLLGSPPPLIVSAARASGKMELIRYLAMRHKALTGRKIVLLTPSGVKEL